MGYDIVTMADCASNYGTFEVPASKGTRTVHWSGSESMPHCGCDGFKYRQDCKHVKYVMEHACLYNPQWHDGQEDPELRPLSFNYDAFIPGEDCPACGGPVVAVRRAV